MTNPTVVVTGAAGFIGSNLCRALLGEGYRVVGIDNLVAGLLENLPDGVEFYRQDVRDEGLEKHFAGASAIFHLAAKNTLLDCIQAPLETVDHNVRGTVAVLEAMRRAGVDRLVYADTSAEYEGVDQFPSSVETVRPLGVYAASKRSGALFCESYVYLYGLRLTTCRYFNVYGPAQDWRRSLPPVMSAFALRMLRGERPLIYGTGEKRRDFIHVDDVNRFHLLALRNEATVGGIFNLGSAIPTSINEVYQLVEAILQTGLTPLYQAELPGEADTTHADISEAVALGWRPQISLEQGVREFVDYIAPLVRAGKARLTLDAV